MRLLIVLSILFHQFSGRAQDAINLKDADDRKQGKWVYYGKDRPEIEMPPSFKYEEGNYVNDRKEGFWIRYYKDGTTIKLKGHYVNNRPCGDFEKFYENGVLKEKGRFIKNVYRDTNTRYYDNGQLRYQAFYDSLGRENGIVIYYYSNGSKEFEYFAKQGIPAGNTYRFYQNGDTSEIVVYRSGDIISSQQKSPIHSILDTEPVQIRQLPPYVGATPNTGSVVWNPNGYNKVYNSNNEIWQDGVFKDGQLYTGKIYVYDSSGTLLKVGLFKDPNSFSIGK